MALSAAKARVAIRALLKEKKSLNEKQVKESAAKVLGVAPAEVGGGLIRDVRRTMGIDRPAALAFAKQALAKDPQIPARKLIDELGQRFGIRIGPPDVSRLRPASVKATRRAGRPPKAKTAKAKAKAARTPKPAAAKKAVAAAKPAASAPTLTVSRPGKGGAVTVRFEGSGHPDDLAAFFLSLGRTA